MTDTAKIETFELEKPTAGAKQIINTYEELEGLKINGWDLIVEIRSTTQNEENQRNIANKLRQNERIEALKHFEEQIPQHQKELEQKMQSLMELEQADELQIVISILILAIQ